MRPDDDYPGNQGDFGSSSHTFGEAIDKFNQGHDDADVGVGQIVAVDVDNRKADCKMGEKRYYDTPWVLPVFNSKNGNGTDYIPQVGQRVVMLTVNQNAIILGAIPQETDPSENESEINYKKNRDPRMNSMDWKHQMNEDLGSHMWLRSIGVLEFFAESWTFLNVDGIKHLIEAHADNIEVINNQSGSWRWRTDVQRRGDEPVDGNSFIEFDMKGNVDEDTPLLMYRVGKTEDGEESKVRIEINSTEINGENPLEIFVEGDASLKSDSNISLTTTGEKKPGHIDVTLEGDGDLNVTAKKGDINTVAEKGDITNTAQEGDINTVAEKGDITNTAQEGDVTIEAPQSAVNISAAKEINAQSDGSVKINAKSSVNVQSQGTAKVEAQGNATVSSQGPVTIKSSSTVSVKAPSISLG